MIVEDITYKLNLIPSGIIRGKVCFLGQGIVLDPEHFLKEYEKICEKISNPKIYLSSNIPLILPYHKQLDKINESILSGEDKIGTTAKGIGPAYQDKVGRKSIKLYDLKSSEKVKEKLENIKKFYDPVLNAYQEEPINIEQYLSILDSFYTRVGSLIVDNSFIKKNFNQNNITVRGRSRCFVRFRSWLLSFCHFLKYNFFKYYDWFRITSRLSDSRYFQSIRN